MLRPLYIVDKGQIRNARKLVELGPIRSCVARYLDQAVVGSHREQALDLGRLVQCGNGAVHGGALLVGNRIESLNFTHNRNQVAVQLPR